MNSRDSSAEPAECHDPSPAELIARARKIGSDLGGFVDIHVRGMKAIAPTEDGDVQVSAARWSSILTMVDLIDVATFTLYEAITDIEESFSPPKGGK